MYRSPLAETVAPSMKKALITHPTQQFYLTVVHKGWISFHQILKDSNSISTVLAIHIPIEVEACCN